MEDRIKVEWDSLPESERKKLIDKALECEELRRQLDEKVLKNYDFERFRNNVWFALAWAGIFLEITMVYLLHILVTK